MSRFLLTAALLATALVPHVSANNCYYDAYGNYYCNNGWSTGARVGVGIGIFVAGLLLVCCLAIIRRRRVQRVNKAFAMAQQNGTNVQAGQPGYGPGVYRPNSGYGPGFGQQPQYPQQAYAQPQQPSFGPGSYAPPPGAPPTGGYKPPMGAPVTEPAAPPYSGPNNV